MIILALAFPAVLAVCGSLYLTACDDDDEKLPRRRIGYWLCCLLCCVFVPPAIIAAKPDLNVGALAAIVLLIVIGFVINAVVRTRYVTFPWTARSANEPANAVAARPPHRDRADAAAESAQGEPWPTSRPSRSQATLRYALIAMMITLSAIAAASLMGPARTPAAVACGAFCFLAAASAPGVARKYEHPDISSQGLGDAVFHCWRGATFTARVVPAVTLASLSIATILVGTSSSPAPAELANGRGVAVAWYAVGAMGLATALAVALKPGSASRWTEIRVDDRGVIVVGSRTSISIDWRSTVDLRALPTTSHEIRPMAEIVITMANGIEVTYALGRARVDPNVIWSTLIRSRDRAIRR